MIALAVIAGSTFRRMLTLRSLTIAAVAGLLAGLLVAGMPSPELAATVLTPLVTVFAALLVLPLVAGQLTADRAGGFEQVLALRPMSSLSWTLGRTFGAVTGAGWLVVVMAGVARLVAGQITVPEDVVGVQVARTTASVEWRFSLPSEASGPFDLAFDVIMASAPTGHVAVDVRRGRSTQLIDKPLVAQRRAVVPIPDMRPATGDLFVTLRASHGVLFTSSPATLEIGERPMSQTRLPLSKTGMTALLLGLFAVLAGASAFRFETACLAGLLAVVVRIDPPMMWPVWMAVLVVTAVFGVSLARRQAMP